VALDAHPVGDVHPRRHGTDAVGLDHGEGTRRILLGLGLVADDAEGEQRDVDVAVARTAVPTRSGRRPRALGTARRSSSFQTAQRRRRSTRRGSR
jgi:hypothetical protein